MMGVFDRFYNKEKLIRKPTTTYYFEGGLLYHIYCVEIE